MNVELPSELNADSFHGPSTMPQSGEDTQCDMFFDWLSR